MVRRSDAGLPAKPARKDRQGAAKVSRTESPPDGGWRLAGIAALALLAAGLLTFSNALDNPFLFDDHPAILENPTIQQRGSPWGPLWAPQDSPLAGRPVANFSFAVNFALGGFHPRGYHLANLGLHIACGCLLFGVARRTLMSERVAAPLRTHAGELSLAIALLWLIHPLQTEVINYVTQRTELLVGFFYLLTLYAAIRAWTAPRPWFAIAVASCALGMASKEVMVTAPVVVILHDLAFVGGPVREIIRRRAKLYAFLAATWMVLFALLLTRPRTNSVGFHLGMSAWDYARTQCWVISHYLRICFWPDRLLIDYGDTPRLSPEDVIPGAIVIAGLMVLTIASWRRRRPWGFLGAWFFLILSPSSSFVPIVTEVGADRRMYLPLAAVVAGVVGVVFWLLHRRLASPTEPTWKSRAALAALVVLLAAPLGVRSYLRNQVYATQVSVWTNAVAGLPTNARAYAMLSHSLRIEEARYHEAADAAKRALELKPSYVPAWVNLAEALIGLEQYEEAARIAAHAATLNPRIVEAHLSLVWALRKLGKREEAAQAAAKAVEFAPTSPKAWLELANAVHEKGDRENAIAYCRRAIALDAQYAEAYNYLGALSAVSNPPYAIAQYRRAIEINPKFPEAHNNLANALARLGWLDEAVRHYRTAIRLKPDYPEARQNLAVVLEAQHAARASRNGPHGPPPP